MQSKTLAAERPHLPTNPPRRYSTEELAALLKVKPQTIRAGLCRDGHYQGLKPCKSRNRFLLWPADEADCLAAGVEQ